MKPEENHMKLTTITLLLGALFIGCEDAPKQQEQKPVAKVEKPAPKAEKPAPKPKAKPKPKADPGAKVTVGEDGVAALTIEATDAMQYSANRFEVEAGQKIRLTFKHTGNLPKAAMGHNIIILKAGVELSGFANEAQGAGPTKDYFADGQDDKVIARSKLIGGGETDVIEFTAPEPGEYDYFCSYPGHWSIMKGKMVVVAKAK